MPLSLLRAGRRPAVLLPDTVEIAGRAVPLRLNRHPLAKRLTLRLKDGGIAVTAPPRASSASVLDFVERHRGWIAARLDRAAPTLVVEPGAVLPFRGGELTLVHRPDRRGTAFQEIDGASHLVVGGGLEHFSRRVADALKRAARSDLQAAVDRHAATVGLKPKALALKDTTSRWGSCTADRRLAFSWRIVMAPPAVLDYLAAHEVAHFRQMNHGADFWALCRELCPGTPAGRAWLKANGASLHAIDFGAK
ncbi:M48 family metallopeptidase [Aureimonas leprariae]|uniref:M48 family metallopeptidase n=1 Tax=Plantimonas leprariae TaxID=2615207 RepID=A0A7V7TY80_9HYPH|nr:SprT family zinc-dependent metalloprotease [Aureimonas leprariae]KAB0682905.1 M48 family metallopeptidase [Aureimonas leprariae]